MSDEIEGCLADYLRVAGKVLSSQEYGDTDGSGLCASLERTEKSKEFGALAQATGQAFNRSKVWFHGEWEMRAQTFLRLAGVYTRLARGEVVPPQEVSEQYHEAFQSNHFKVTYLAPLEYVEFSQDSIDFGQFQIRRFSSEELDDLFQNSVRQLFYPSAVVKSSVLADYWFLRAEETVSGSPLDDWDTIIMDARVRPSYSTYPSAVQAGMRQLALFDWGSELEPIPAEPRPTSRTEWDAPFLPRIPFVIQLSDSLLTRPSGPPDVGSLSTEPDFVPETGEEMGEKPASRIFMNEKETAKFQTFLSRTTELMKAIEPYRLQWRFVDTSLDFLLKAYTTEGLEQLLWHVTTIEAILGQRGTGITKRLLNRTSSILGATANERKDFRNRFEKLYAFRSELVHGNANLADKTIHLGHLSEARDFARSTVAWMLNYLGQVAKDFAGSPEAVPTRDHLINVLDLDPNGRRQTAKVLQCLPAEFPNVKDWLR